MTDDRSLTPSPIPRVHPPGRARTLEEKRAIVEAILVAWAEAGDLRLGQLLVCATHGQNMFMIEDDALFDAMFEFKSKVRKWFTE